MEDNITVKVSSTDKLAPSPKTIVGKTKLRFSDWCNRKRIRNMTKKKNFIHSTVKDEHIKAL